MPDSDDKKGNRTGESGSNNSSPSIISFPQSRTKPKTSQPESRELSLSKLAQKLNAGASLKGHWCSQCKGIWYGYGGECECPVCGNRNG